MPSPFITFRNLDLPVEFLPTIRLILPNSVLVSIHSLGSSLNSSKLIEMSLIVLDSCFEVPVPWESVTFCCWLAWVDKGFLSNFTRFSWDYCYHRPEIVLDEYRPEINRSCMPKPGPKVPKEANRGPRNASITFHLSEEEKEELGRVAENFGFRSRSALVAWMMEPLIKEGFTGASFARMGKEISNIQLKRPGHTFDYKQLRPWHKLPLTPKEIVDSENEPDI